MNIWSFLTGFVTGSIILSICMGAVPNSPTVQPEQFKPSESLGAVTDDTALYQNLSEIRVAPEKSMDFDQDLHRLSRLENRYRERVRPLNPRERMSAPMKRVSQAQYKPVAVRKSAPQRTRKIERRAKQSRPRIGVPSSSRMNSH